MALLLYPNQVRGLTWTILKTPEWNTSVQAAGSGSEIRIRQMLNPVWHWQLTYDYLYDFPYISPNNIPAYAPYSDLQEMLGFFLLARGQYTAFLFNDPTDNYVGPALNPDGTPNPQAQLQIFTDGAGNYYTPIQRTLSGRFWEDILALNGSISVYANGALTTDYTIGSLQGLAIPGYSFGGLYIQWNNPPATPITAQFNFYFVVRFEDDTQDFEHWARGLWTIGGSSSQKGSGQIKLISTRPTTQIFKPFPTPLPRPVKVIQTVVFNTITDHIYGQSYNGIGVITLNVNPNAALWVQTDYFCWDTSAWLYRTNSETMNYNATTQLVTTGGGGSPISGGPRTSTLHDIVATYYSAGTILGGSPHPNGDFMNVYEAWLDITYTDGTTDVMRPTLVIQIPGDGHITGPSLAIDGNKSTAANVERNGFTPSPYYGVPGLQLTNFVIQ